jgi:DNA-binding GntR family transcriptional regulator
MTDSEPIESRRLRQNLKQEAAKHIRDLIFSGEVRAGQRLDQDKLAKDLGVSRLPVREALITLEAEGMVNNIARRGSFVARLEPDDIIDHFRMYGLISGVAAARVAESREAEVLGSMADIAQLMRETTIPSEHDRLNYRFHQAINRAGGSRRLISVLRILSDNMPSHFFESNAEWEFRDQAFAEHDEILAAMRAGDGAAAAAAVATHFAHTGEQAVRTLRSAGFWDDES